MKFIDAENMYPLPSWGAKLKWRDDMQKLEVICEHGVGHPHPKWLEDYPESSGVHGCDGCCNSIRGGDA